MTASKEYLWLMFVSWVHNLVCVYRESEEGDGEGDRSHMQSKYNLSSVRNTE